MKLVMLGAPRRHALDSWKDHIADAGVSLGWDVTHFPAQRVPVDTVIRACKGADVLLWARTHGHEPSGDALRMLRSVEDSGTRTVALHLDLYWGIRQREERLKTLPWATCQYMFTADGSHDQEFSQLGINHYWCPPPIGEAFHGYGTKRARYPHRYVFVGSYVPGIHGPHRRALLNWARRTYRHQFLQYGTISKVYGEDLNDLYASTFAVLGDSAPCDLYWSDRVPRTVGRGGLLVHADTVGFQAQGFIDGETLLTYPRGNFQVIQDKLSGLTAQARRDIIDNAMTLVKERHLWTHRLQMIQDVVLT